MTNKITTERICLEDLSVDDHDFIHKLVNTEGWLQFIGDRNIHESEDAIAYINKIKNSPNIHYWVARLIESGTPMGIITFIKRDYLEHFDIGFAFLPGYEKNGYAYEATKAVLSVIRAEPGNQTVLAVTKPDNIRSIKLLSRLGMHFDHERDITGDKFHIYLGDFS